MNNETLNLNKSIFIVIQVSPRLILDINGVEKQYSFSKFENLSPHSPMFMGMWTTSHHMNNPQLFFLRKPMSLFAVMLKKHAMYTMVTRTVSWEHVSERQCQLRMNLILLRTLMIPSPDLTIQGVTKKPNNFISNGMAKIYTG